MVRLPPPDLCDLRDLRASHLQDLLAEEESVWRNELSWDFQKSSALVRKFVDLAALSGSALVTEDQVIGYCYYVVEDQKGLLGDLFVRRAFQSTHLEQRLLSSMVEALIAMPAVNRIESQLMLLRAPLEMEVTAAPHFHSYPRDFLIMATPAVEFPARPLPRGLSIVPWTDAQQDGAASVIAATYAGHVDGLINDQYRSPAGARRFLYNIVQYPGCGVFFQPASFTAFHRATRDMRGICLASIVAPGAGHITQVCVTPRAQGQGLGYELLRQSIEALRAAGCTRVSLTVTSENHQAMALYHAMGFTAIRKFAAYVWEGW